VRDHTVIYCLLLHICKSSSLPAWWQYVIDTSKKKNLSFCTILLMLFYTLGVSIYRLIIFLYFCSLQTRGIDRISIRYIHYFSLWLAHLVDISKFKFSEANSNRIIDTHWIATSTYIWEKKRICMSMSIILSFFFLNKKITNLLFSEKFNKPFYEAYISIGSFIFFYLPMCSGWKRREKKAACQWVPIGFRFVLRWSWQ
jgi:hypothetical protein